MTRILNKAIMSWIQSRKLCNNKLWEKVRTVKIFNFLLKGNTIYSPSKFDLWTMLKAAELRQGRNRKIFVLASL